MRRLATTCLLSLCSCATIVHGGPFFVPVDSHPQGALVSYRGVDLGRTPCEIRMDMKRGDVLELQLEGHHPREVEVGTRSNLPLVLVGMLLWGPFELIVDASTQSWSRIDDLPLLVQLAAIDQPRPSRMVRESGKRKPANDLSTIGK